MGRVAGSPRRPGLDKWSAGPSKEVTSQTGSEGWEGATVERAAGPEWGLAVCILEPGPKPPGGNGGSELPREGAGIEGKAPSLPQG